MNSVGRGPLGLNRFGMEKNRTESKLIGLNRFRFGSVQKIKKKFGLVVYFGLKLDRTGNVQP
jgi:hypothetical protein